MREIVGRTPSDEIRTGGRQVAQDQREAASAAVPSRELRSHKKAGADGKDIK